MGKDKGIYKCSNCKQLLESEEVKIMNCKPAGMRTFKFTVCNECHDINGREIDVDIDMLYEPHVQISDSNINFKHEN